MFTREKCLRILKMSAIAVIFTTALGCPPVVLPQNDYDLGLDDGFAQDDWYWQGYADSYDTIDFGPIYYQGSTIPSYTTPEYDAGYWDGVWYAYNDGYFTEYRYAFIIGFSEGYDNAFWSDYLTFLANDVHTEYADGGWSDGYNDGFSEGRVFGANDYEQGLTFDWMDALLDYESGTDLYFQEVDVGTGAYGPVVLYEYGTDPAAKKSLLGERKPRAAGVPSIRVHQTDGTKVNLDTRELYRPLTSSVQAELNYTPAQSIRDTAELRLTTTWLKRVNDYVAVSGKSVHPERARIAPPQN
ncbi:MAG: hypothetical protein HZB26_18560 [Candidatus Hydrogenedentes bacterium]|nr:hypothetical protein [Candidatus Hydrogenedentota bacterium]